MFSNRANLGSSTIILILTVVIGGCSSTRTTENDDPHESINRKMYNFNDTLDKSFVEPVAESYVKVTPEPVRAAITNFFDNQIFAYHWHSRNQNKIEKNSYFERIEFNIMKTISLLK